MASSYSPKLRFELIAPGEQAGLWGDTTNNNIGDLIEQAIAGVANIDLASKSGDVVLEAKDGTVDQARSAVLSCFGTSAGDVNLVIPSSTKLYVVRNASSNDVYVKTASQLLGTKIGAGEANLVYCDGSIAQAGIVIAGASVAPVSAGGTGVGSPGFTAGYLKSPGGTTAFTTVAGIPSTDISGQVGTAQGGTGISTAPSAGTLLIGTSGGGYASNTITAGSGITVTNSSGGITISTSGASGVSSISGTNIGVSSPTGAVNLSLNSTNVINALGYTPANGSLYALLSGATFSGSVSASGFTASGAGSIGDQKFSVGYGGYNTGISPTSIQLASSGNGVIYTPSGAWDGSSGVGLILSSGAGNLQITTSDTLFTGADNCYKTGSTTAWIITSDARIKKNVTPYTKGLSELNQVNIKNFEFNGLANSIEGAKGIGVIADEIEQVLPDTVKTNNVKLHPDDEERTAVKHFDSTELVYLLVNAVKELSAKVTALEEQVLNLSVK